MMCYTPTPCSAPYCFWHGKTESKKEEVQESEPECKEKKGLQSCVRIGNWEEMYDSVDGTKTWYNTATQKTTNKDPFF